MISRREFVTNVAATTAAVTIVPRHVLGRGQTPPSDRLNIAGVGVGGMGKTNLLNLGLDNNIVALYDVDWGYAGRAWSALDADLKREEGRLPKVTEPAARRNSDHRIASLKTLIAKDVPKQKRHKSVGDPPQTLARITTSHEVNWSDACKGKGQATTPFEYAAKLTEVMVLGA